MNERIKEVKAIEFVMQYYNKTKEEVEELYMDEVIAYMSLMERIKMREGRVIR